jgi:hypothetical protein
MKQKRKKSNRLTAMVSLPQKILDYFAAWIKSFGKS